MALPTSADAIEAFNKRAYKEYEEKTLMTCPYCSRTFKSALTLPSTRAMFPFLAYQPHTMKLSMSSVTLWVPGSAYGHRACSMQAAHVSSDGDFDAAQHVVQ